MKIAYLNPFIEAGVETLASLVGGQTRPGRTAARSALYTTAPVSVVVDISGDLTGAVIFGMSQMTAAILASAMVGQHPMIFNEMTEHAISKLANLISGRAVTGLEAAGWTCATAEPQVLLGTDIEVARIPALVFSFHSKCGRIDVSIAIQETTAVPVAAGETL